MPAFETDVQAGTYQVRHAALIDTPRIELRWDNVDIAAMMGVRQHFAENGAKGKTFDYQDMPAVTLPEGHYSYDEPLLITRSGARSVSLRAVLVRALAFD
jgi:hypothetical protein